MMAFLVRLVLWGFLFHGILGASVSIPSKLTKSTISIGSSRYADGYKASPTTIKFSKTEKSADLLPENSFSLGYSNKFLHGGLGLGGFGHGHGFGGHFQHGYHQFGHYGFAGGPLGHFHPYNPYHQFGHHFQYQHGYNYLHGGYPRYIFHGLHHGYL